MKCLEEALKVYPGENNGSAISSSFEPSGDQLSAIKQLIDGLSVEMKRRRCWVLLVPETFTIANVLKEVKRPALVLSHNKTLAAQLYSEFKAFFLKMRVEYFVSYYDYYQPEAYLPNYKYLHREGSFNQ